MGRKGERESDDDPMSLCRGASLSLTHLATLACEQVLEHIKRGEPHSHLGDDPGVYCGEALVQSERALLDYNVMTSG